MTKSLASRTIALIALATFILVAFRSLSLAQDETTIRVNADNPQTSVVTQAGQNVIVEADGTVDGRLNGFGIDASAGGSDIFFHGEGKNRTILAGNDTYILFGDTARLPKSDRGAKVLLDGSGISIEVEAGAQLDGEGVPVFLGEKTENGPITLTNAGSLQTFAPDGGFVFPGNRNPDAIRIAGANGSTIFNSGVISGDGAGDGIVFSDSGGTADRTTFTNANTGNISSVSVRRGDFLFDNSGQMGFVKANEGTPEEVALRPEPKVLVQNRSGAELSGVSVGSNSLTPSPDRFDLEIENDTEAKIGVLGGDLVDRGGIRHLSQGQFRLNNKGTVAGNDNAIRFASGDTEIVNEEGALISSLKWPITAPREFEGKTIYGYGSVDDNDTVPTIMNFGTIAGGLTTIQIDGAATIINENVITIEDPDGRIGIAAIVIGTGLVKNSKTIFGQVSFADGTRDDAILLNPGDIEDPDFRGVYFSGGGSLYGLEAGTAHNGTIKAYLDAVEFGRLADHFENAGTIESVKGDGIVVLSPNGKTVRNSGTVVAKDEGNYAINFEDSSIDDIDGSGAHVVNLEGGILEGGIRFEHFNPEQGSGTVVNSGIIKRGEGILDGITGDAIRYDTGMTLHNTKTGVIQAGRNVNDARFVAGVLDVTNEGLMEAGRGVISFPDSFRGSLAEARIKNTITGKMIGNFIGIGGIRGSAGQGNLALDNAGLIEGLRTNGVGLFSGSTSLFNSETGIIKGHQDAITIRDLVAGEFGNATNAGSIISETGTALRVRELHTNLVNLKVAENENSGIIEGESGGITVTEQNGHDITNDGEIIVNFYERGTTDGILVLDGPGTITNGPNGEITVANGNGIRVLNGTTSIRNSGKIEVTAGSGVHTESGMEFSNQSGGKVYSTGDAVFLGDQRDHGLLNVVVNAAGATIEADTDRDGIGAAITAYEGEELEAGIERVFNSGNIIGDVELGANDDLFVAIDEGTVSSVVDGGSGSDIVRFAAERVDQAFSTPFLDFEILEKTGDFQTELTGVFNNRQARVFGGTLILGEVTGSTGQLRLSTDGDTLLMGDINSDPTTTKLVVRQNGSFVGGSAGPGNDPISIIGDRGQQVIVNSEARIEGEISLGDGDDKVSNNFGTFIGDIDLGSGNDELEVFLRDEGGIGKIGGEIIGAIDGGDGEDTIRYSLEQGAVTLSKENAEAIEASGGLTSFELIAKGGAGEITFDFDEINIGGKVLETNTFDIEGPVTFRDEATAFIDPNNETSGIIFLGEATAPSTQRGFVEGRILNNASLTAQRGISMRGQTRIVNSLGASISTEGVLGIEGDDGAQSVETSGEIVLSGGGRIDLKSGDDTLTIFRDGSVIGASEGGLGNDSLAIDTASGATRSPAASDFSGFETVNLNASVNANGTFVLSGDTTVKPGESGGYFNSETGSSSVVLHRGVLTGNGTIGGELNIGVGATIAPGDSIGTIRPERFTLMGGFEVEYRVPDFSRFAVVNGAFVGRNQADGTAASLADQDADLIWVSGTANLSGFSNGFTISEYVVGSAPGATIAGALASNTNTAREVRYPIVISTELVGVAPEGFLILGDVDGDPTTDQSIAVTDSDNNGTPDRLELVFSASGTGGPGPGPTGDPIIVVAARAPQLPESYILRPDRFEAGCGKSAYSNLSSNETKNLPCIWADLSGSLGNRADLPIGASDDYNNWQLDFGTEMSFADATGLRLFDLGLFGGYGGSQNDLTSGVDSKIDTFRLGAYGELADHGFEASSSVIWSLHDVKSERTGVSGTRLTGNTDAWSLSLDAEVARWFKGPVSGWQLAPFGGLTYSYGYRDEFSEESKSAEAFSYESADGQVLWGRFGLKSRFETKQDAELPMRLSLSAGADLSIASSALGTKGTFAGNPTVVSAPGKSRFDQSAFVADADLEAILSDNTSFEAGVGFRAGSDAIDATLSARLKITW